MMRDIKFRAWVPKGYTRWGGGGLVLLSWEDLLGDLHSEINPIKSVMGLGMFYEQEGVMFMQYTGLKDKNGQEIYEGDIIETVSGMGYVKWYDEGACFRFMIEGNSESPLNYDERQVIGNIYEHPELLAKPKGDGD